MQFRALLVYSTANDCSGSFVWSTWSQPRIVIGATAKVVSAAYTATIDDCAVFIPLMPTLADGSALPSYVTYSLQSNILTLNIDPSVQATTLTINFTAKLDDRVTLARSNNNQLTIEIKEKATSISLASTSLSVEYEVGFAKTFNLPSVSCLPLDAALNVVYSAAGAPSWLSFLAGA